jgi:hypothetical protein
MVDAFLHELNDNGIIYIPNGTEGMCLAGNVHTQLENYAQGEYKKEFEDEEVSIGFDVNGEDKWTTIVSTGGLSPRHFIGDPGSLNCTTNFKGPNLLTKIRTFLFLHFTRLGWKTLRLLKEFDE